MQFKHPEILYVLFALLIPILIHLFQLQRFTKTSFTNLKFLKKIELQTRKSSRLKKWLVLLSRLIVFASIIIAFAQPFFSKNDISKEWLTAIYLDNSLSMQAKGKNGEILKRAVQDIVEYLPQKGEYILLTNDGVFTELTQKEFIEKVKNIQYSPSRSSSKHQLFKIRKLLNANSDKHNKILLISDFQEIVDFESNLEETSEKNNLFSKESIFDYVQLIPKSPFNISIDNVSILEKNNDNTVLEITLFNQGEENKSVSITALQNKTILAKNSIEIPAEAFQKTSFRIPNTIDKTTIKIDTDDAFSFDNTYYISFQQENKINVFVISENNSFFERIYTPDEFNLTQKRIDQISFEQIDKQQLVIVNGLQNIPKSLQNKLVSYINNGGNLVIIPHKKNTIDDLNTFFNQLKIGQLIAKKTDSLKITKIHFSHPILRKVFDKKVTNFQYPNVHSYFKSSLIQAQPILSFDNQESFISQIEKQNGTVYWVAAALDSKNSNFPKSPLIVPVFYNIGKRSAIHSQLSYRIGQENKISIDKKITQDEVLHIVNDQFDFIPMQEIKSDHVILITEKQPKKAGFYEVISEYVNIKNLAFNNPKEESNLSFLKMKALTQYNKNIKQHQNIKGALSHLTAEQSIQSYFKWFVLLAFLFILIEILLLKYL